MRLSEIKSSNKAKQYINKVYAMFPENPLNPRQVYMTFDDGIAVVELVPSFDVEDAAEIKWIQVNPQGVGIGRQAIKKLQSLADLPLTLYPWSQNDSNISSLISFYKSLGFEEIDDEEILIWRPKQ